MTTKELKVKLFSEAILKSNVAIWKGAKVELVEGNLLYTLEGKKTSGTYRFRTTYKEVLCMLQREDIINIMAL